VRSLAQSELNFGYNYEVVRRLVSNLILAVVVAGLFSPAAMASVTQPHACCLRGQSHNCAQPVEIGFRNAAEDCQHCSPGLTLAPHRVFRPEAAPAVSAGRDAHPFLSEFYPASDSPDSSSDEAQRAPPDISSRQ
jgi:hypothetical protein